MGWKVKGLLPQQPKYIVTLAPHTSNWDFVVGVAILLASSLKISFLIKHSLFIWPFSVFLRAIGGVPVNRRAAGGIVGDMIKHFATHDKMVLAIAPEGTRSSVKEWKVGFIHIANNAKVPIVPISLDYEKKLIEVGEPISLMGEVNQDLATVKAFYKGAKGKNR